MVRTGVSPRPSLLVPRLAASRLYALVRGGVVEETQAGISSLVGREESDDEEVEKDAAERKSEERHPTANASNTTSNFVLPTSIIVGTVHAVEETVVVAWCNHRLWKPYAVVLKPNNRNSMGTSIDIPPATAATANKTHRGTHPPSPPARLSLSTDRTYIIHIQMLSVRNTPQLLTCTDVVRR